MERYARRGRKKLETFSSEEKAIKHCEKLLKRGYCDLRVTKRKKSYIITGI